MPCTKPARNLYDLKVRWMGWMVAASVGAFTLCAKAKDYELAPSHATQEGLRRCVMVNSEAMHTLKIIGGKRSETNSISTVEGDFVVHPATVDVKTGFPLQELNFNKLITTTPRGTKLLLSAGQTVVKRQIAGETVYKLKGGDLKLETYNALESLLGKHVGARFDEDALINARGRKKIGDSWPMNSDLMAQVLSHTKPEMAFKAKDVQPVAKLVSVKRVNGIECLEIGSKVKAKGVMTLLGQQENITILTTGTILRPMDPLIQSPGYEMKMGIKSKFTRWMKGVSFSFDFTGEMAGQAHFESVK